jgi:hypothetical protein
VTATQSEELDLLLALDDLGVDTIYRSGHWLYLFPAEPGRTIQLPAVLRARLENHRAWFLRRVKPLPAAVAADYPPPKGVTH